MIYDYVVNKPPIDELYHHGILGMHWGQRNGPPYPLSKAISTGNRLKKKAIKDAKKGNKWATSKTQPSSFKSSWRAASYARNPNARNKVNLAIANHEDELRWKEATKEYKRNRRKQ